jgi:hypothetical protein
MDRAVPLCRQFPRFRFQTGPKVATGRLGRDGGLLREERFALPTCIVFRQTALHCLLLARGSKRTGTGGTDLIKRGA